jgi:hypothetical protein
VKARQVVAAVPWRKARSARLLWQQRLATSLHGRLDADSELEVTA